MNEDQKKATVSHYGLVTMGRQGADAYLDIFVPELLLRQLELRPGSKVIVQGLADREKQEFYLRAHSGLEDEHEETPFTASLRFKNEPQVLARFLALANEKKIDFRAIRTFGYRGTDESDLIFEGSVPDRQHHFVYRHNLKALLESAVDGLRHHETREIQATVISHEVLRFKETVSAEIGTSVYRLDIPVLRDRFLKVRVSVIGDMTGPFSEMQLTLARLSVELDSMTLAIKTELGNQDTFLLVFEGRDLEKGYPVTSTILNVLPDFVNVDAISAYEYLAFDSEASDPRKLKAMGRIEMLCVAPTIRELDHALVQRTLEAEIGKILEDTKRLKLLMFEPVSQAFVRLRKELGVNGDDGNINANNVNAKHVVGVFNEALNDRYVRTGTIGSGSSGVVYKYLDLLTKQMVAGKHFPDATKIGSAELKTLVDRSFGIDLSRQSKNFPKLHDYFIVDSVPVIVTELLPIILGNHERSPYRDDKVVPHQHPNSFREFAHMATQVCTALESLHSRKTDTGQEVASRHGDVKAVNIGAALEEGRLVWKLIDFGLVKEFGGERTRTQDQPVGTPSYMSPDAVAGPRTHAVDIFALGVTFFEVLCGWQQPGIQESGKPYPNEIIRYLEYLKDKKGAEPPGFDPARFILGGPFKHAQASPQLIEELRNIVFGMLAMSAAKRTASASVVKQQIIEWAGRLRQ